MEPVEVAEAGQVKTGKAIIYSNVSGEEVRAYEVEITKLFPSPVSIIRWAKIP